MGKCENPRLEYLDQPDPDGCVPVNGLTPNVTMNFDILSGYFILHCPKFATVSDYDETDAAKLRMVSGLQYHRYNGSLRANWDQSPGYEYNSWYLGNSHEQYLSPKIASNDIPRF